MIPRSTRLFFFGFFLFSFLSATLPLPAEAALVPCGRSSGTAAEQAPCTVCHLVVGGKGVIDYGLKIMTFVAIAVIVAMAIFYIVSTGDEGMMQTAKSGIKAALIGFAVMLGAWLIVNTTLRILSANISGLTVSSSGFSFTCDTSSSANTAAGTPSNTSSLVATSGATSVSVPASGGTIAVPAGSSVFFPAATVVTTPAPGIITLANGATQSVLSGSTVTVPAGATLSFPSGAATLTLPQGGTPTLIAAESSNPTSRNNTAPATLSVVRDGEGTVTGSGIDCRTDCQELYPAATSIILTATPAPGFLFASWGGACSGNSPTCSVSMTEARSVTADFIPIPPPGTFLLSVAKEGSGTGTVTATGLDCGLDCSETYTNNPTITLTATPAPGSVFTDWFGACSGSGACSIPMNSTQKVTASFQSTATEEAESVWGGGGSCVNYGDPGSGLWIPPNTTGRVVADHMMLNSTVSYVPGCLGQSSPSCSSCGCAVNDSYTQNGITAHLGGGKTLLLRYKTQSTVTDNKSIKVRAWNGGNVAVNMRTWLSTNPTATYASVSTACKANSSGVPMIITGSVTNSIITTQSFTSTISTPVVYCKLEPDTVYYFGIEFPEVVSGNNARFQVENLQSNFLSTSPGPSAVCVNSGGSGGGNSGDPGIGSGLWIPPNTTGRLIADQSGTTQAMTSYVPGCLNGNYITSASASGCGGNAFFTGPVANTNTSTTFSFGSGKILGLRYMSKVGAGTTPKYVQFSNGGGGNVGVPMKAWLSDSPTATYSATASACKNVSNTDPAIMTGPGYCPIIASKLYYLFMSVDSSIPNQTYKVQEGASDFH